MTYINRIKELLEEATAVEEPTVATCEKPVRPTLLLPIRTEQTTIEHRNRQGQTVQTTVTTVTVGPDYWLG